MPLPNTYYKLKYIESTGTQYINLNMTSATLFKAVIDCEPTVSGQSDQVIISTHNNANSGSRVEIYRGGNNKFALWSSSDYELSSTTAQTRLTVTYEQKLTSKTLTVGELSRTINQSAFTNPYVELLSYVGSSRYYGKYKIYSAKIYNDDVLVRDLVPAMRKSDSVVGLYDLANDVFYTNTGSGTFSYEAEIDAVSVTQNTTSYTFTEKGLYVFTGSVDGGYDRTLGGTCTQLYYQHSYAGTVAILWAEAGQTLTASGGANYNQLVRITGIDKKPKIKYSAENPSITKSGNANDIFIGMAVGHWHGDTSTSYSFTCSGFKREVAHSSSGWSKNAMALMIPFSTSNVQVTVTGASGKYQGFLVQISTGGSIRIKVNGSWKEGTTYIKANGQWKQGEVKTKHTTWKGA